MAGNEKEREATASGGLEESAALERRCTWRGGFFPAYLCKEPVGEAGQLCILHSRDPEKNREKFYARVEEKKKAGDFYFPGTFFPEAVRFTDELKEANFLEARFQGAANFWEARFQGAADFSWAAFQGGAEFREATFQGEAYFLEATFQGEARFSGATFQGAADFLVARFQGAATFWRARFQGEADFLEARFQGKASFESTRFETEARFSGTRFREGVSFLRSRFAGKAYLEQIYLSGTVEFEEAEFGSAVFFRGPFYAAAADEKSLGTEVKQPIPPKLRFENVLLEEQEKARFEGLDLRETTFAGTNVRPIEFRNVKWPQAVWFARLAASARIARLVGAHRWERLVGFFGHNTPADEVRLTKAGDNQEQTERARRVCRDLKASLEDQRDYADAGDFYYAEMELRRRQVGPVRWFLYWLYWLVCGYGEKPLRALVVFVCLWMLLAGIFTQTWFVAEQRVPWRAAEFDAQPKQAFHPYWNEALNHGLRSLTLQQREGYLEAHSAWAIRLTLGANLLGPVQLGLFFLAMRRRFRR